MYIYNTITETSRRVILGRFDEYGKYERCDQFSCNGRTVDSAHLGAVGQRKVQKQELSILMSRV